MWSGFARKRQIHEEVLCADTTFNIAEYRVTETTYKQPSVIRRDNLKHQPHRVQQKSEARWFCTFLASHQEQTLSYRIYLSWKRMKTKHCQEEFYKKRNGLPSSFSAKNTLPTLRRNSFALIFLFSRGEWSCKIFLEDVNEDKDCLYACESEEEYVQNVTNLKEKWNEIEREHTKNNSPNKFVSYFEAHKEEIREKMIKAVRHKANIDGEYGQNPIEWLNFLSKE